MRKAAGVLLIGVAVAISSCGGRGTQPTPENKPTEPVVGSRPAETPPENKEKENKDKESKENKDNKQSELAGVILGKWEEAGGPSWEFKPDGTMVKAGPKGQIARKYKFVSQNTIELLKDDKGKAVELKVEVRGPDDVTLSGPKLAHRLHRLAKKDGQDAKNGTAKDGAGNAKEP